MPTVDFYITTADSEAARLNLVCKIVNKAYQQQQQVYIHCADKAQAETLDDLLWQFNDISFIPHSLVDAALEEQPPVVIGFEPATLRKADVLINCHAELPPKLELFARIIEVVSADPVIKNTARAHYKAYQALDFPLKSHNI
jgi:DNA polymerase-3 subunit chi